MKKSELYKIIKNIVKEQQNLTKPGIDLATDISDKEIDKDNIPFANPANLTCDSTKPYGTLDIYHHGQDCDDDTMITTVDDSFICCSGNNSFQDTTPSNILFTIDTALGGLDIEGNVNGQCYCPSGDLSACLGEGVTQFTFQDLSWFYFYYDGGGEEYIPYCAAGSSMSNDGTYSGSTACNISNYAWAVGPIDDPLVDCGGVVGGCPHPYSTIQSDGTGEYVPTSEGCLDDSGVPSTTFPTNIRCCRFTGCGSVSGNVEANNLGLYLNIDGAEEATYYSQIPAVTNDLGFEFDAINPDDGSDYWVDDQTCQFDQYCTDTEVLLNGINYATDNNQAYEDGVDGSNYYDGTSLDGGVCEVLACADPALEGLTDPLGNTITTTFAVAAGLYLDGAVEVINNNANCTITACVTAGFDTTWDAFDVNNWAYGIIPIDDQGTEDPADDALSYTLSGGGTCATLEVYGCTDSTACNEDTGANALCTDPTTQLNDGVECTPCTYPADGLDCDGNVIPIYGCTNSLSNPIADLPEEAVYDENANTDNGQCIFNYCLDNTMSNYVCIDDYELCETEGAQCTASCPEGQYMDGSGDLPSIGTFSTLGCTDYIYGCTDPDANNYNANADAPCDGINPTDSPVACQSYNALEGESDDNPIQTLEDNPAGCCCTYSPGCTLASACNYNAAATLDDGSCRSIILGCTQPGMTNYDKTANVDDGSCKYEGCVDDGISNQIGTATTSPWQNYVCREGQSDYIGDGTETDTSIECTTGLPFRPATYNMTLKIGEWLCQCGDYPGSVGACTGDSQFNVNYGDYIDGTLGTYSTPEDGIIETLYDYPNNIVGDCSGVMENQGCYGIGESTWMQNDGDGPVEVDLLNYDPTAVNNSTCYFAACANAFAENYFCVDNPDYCTEDMNSFAVGCSTNAQDYPDGNPICLDGDIGTLNLPTFLVATDGCVLPESYDCNNNIGCFDPGDGTGAYSTLSDCQNNCKLCSKVEVRGCNSIDQFGNITATNEMACLLIDGQAGNTSGNPWGEGKEFEYQFISGYGPPSQGQGNVSPLEPKPNPLYGTQKKIVHKFMYNYYAHNVGNNPDFPPTEGWTSECGEGLNRPRPEELIRPEDWCGIQYPCFTPNTSIIMADDTEKTISSVEVGDIVKSEKESSKVIKIDIHKGEFEVYSINGSEHFVTADHPLKTTEGWKSIDPIETFKVHGINSEILKVGDVIIKIDGKEEITSIEGEKTVSEVYNLILDNEHVYYANGYLAHNKDPISIIGEQKQTTTDMQVSITCCSEFGPQDFPISLSEYQNTVCQGDKLDSQLNIDFCQNKGLIGPPCVSEKTIQEQKLRKLIRKTFKKLDNK